jgi:LPXTG-motif cell wall-anchored protein
VPAPRRIAAAAVTIAVAFAPGAAVAQNGAGDEQYEDPFSEQPQTAPKPKPKKAQPSPAQPAPHQQLPSQAQDAPTTQQADPQVASGAQPAPGGELPRTGLDLVPLALAGVALVAAGLLLRRRAGHGRG